MKHILFFTFLFSFVLASGQSHMFIPDSNAYWSILHLEWTSYYTLNPYGVQGDTLINGNTYIQIHQSNDSVWDPLNTSYYCATREVEDKWMFVPQGSEIEYLLYDFDVVVGDTIDINNPWTAGEVETVVTAIDSIMVVGEMRTQIHVEAIYGGFAEVWIEGIGSSNGLFHTAFYVFDVGFQLTCFHENDSLIYINSPNGDCYFFHVGVEENEQVTWWDIAPNPAHEYFSIKLDRSDVLIHSLQIHDAAGRLMLNLKEDNLQDRVAIDNLESGLYYVRLVYDDDKSSVKPLIVNR